MLEDPLAQRVNLEDVMIRDTNPNFQNRVENTVLKQLMEGNSGRQQKNGPGKLINWKIINQGRQTIIVL
jgi:hypothetical protein